MTKGEGAARAVPGFPPGVGRIVLALGFALCAGATAVSPVAAAQLSGIDVSHHNGRPAWDQVKADGVHFAIAKASEGRTWRDDEYVRNRTKADALGLPFTAYHFAQPDTSTGDAVAEADNFVAAAGLAGRHLVPVLDLESHNGLGTRKLVRWTKAWLTEVRAQLGVKAIIYTSPAFWRTRMGNTRWFADNGYRLWIAHWDADTPSVPAANWGGRGWTLWQYSDSGSVAGIDGPVDLDRYSGSRIGVLRIKNNR